MGRVHGGVEFWLSHKEHSTRKMMKNLMILCALAIFLMVTVEAAVVRIARSPQEEEGNPFWWCDPEQAGYAFILNPGVKAWCEENAA